MFKQNYASVDDKEDIICYKECCNDHHDIDKYPKALRYLSYGFLFSIGFSIFLYGIYNLLIRDSDLAKTGNIDGNKDILV